MLLLASTAILAQDRAYYEKGLEQHRTAIILKAWFLARRAMEKDPGVARYHHLLGLSNLVLLQFESGGKSLEKAI